jgi:hypothetical protein
VGKKDSGDVGADLWEVRMHLKYQKFKGQRSQREELGQSLNESIALMMLRPQAWLNT